MDLGLFKTMLGVLDDETFTALDLQTCSKTQRKRSEDAMGFGDIKLMAMMGAFLGALPAMLFVVLFACMAGTAVGIPLMIKQGRGLRLMLPFGPFLALGGLLYVYFGDVLVRTFLLGWA